MLVLQKKAAAKVAKKVLVLLHMKVLEVVLLWC